MFHRVVLFIERGFFFVQRFLFLLNTHFGALKFVSSVFYFAVEFHSFAVDFLLGLKHSLFTKRFSLSDGVLDHFISYLLGVTDFLFSNGRMDNKSYEAADDERGNSYSYH